MKKRIEEFNPDIIYIHNLWFKGSLGLLNVAKKFDIPVVIKIHNFRYLCANTFFSNRHTGNNEFCHACGMKKSLLFNKYFNPLQYFNNINNPRGGKTIAIIGIPLILRGLFFLLLLSSVSIINKLSLKS